MLTKDKRKENSLFTVRANFQTLMYLLNKTEKNILLQLIPDPEIKKLFQAEATLRQNNGIVTLIHDDNIKKFQYTDIMNDITADMMTKIYVEFRILNYVLEKKKVDLSLDDLKTMR